MICSLNMSTISPLKLSTLEILANRNLLIGIVAMFRNPSSHELKVEWKMSEQDALDIMAMISYCHRRLDKAQKIRIEN